MPAPEGRTPIDERGFSDRCVQIGALTVTIKHLGVFRDKFPPHQKRDWWDIVIRGPKKGMEHAATVGGSKAEYEGRAHRRRKKEWGAGPLGHQLYLLNWAASDPDDWYEWEVDAGDRGRKAWDPRQEKSPEQRAKEFLAIAARFDGVIQPAYDLWTKDWDTVMKEAVEI